MKLLILLLFASTAVFAQKIEKTYLNVQISLSPELVLSCKEQQVYYFMSKKQVIFRCLSANFDLTVVDRNIGKYKGWLAVDDSKNYYFILASEIGPFANIMLQPCDKDLTRRDDLPVTIFTNAPICK